MKRLVAVLGNTVADARHEARYLDPKSDVLLLTPARAGFTRGLLIDALFVTPAATSNKHIAYAVEVIRPALVTRRRPRKGR